MYKFLIFLIFSYSNLFSKELRIGFLSSWNIKCGIAVYTKNIVESLKKKKIKVFVYSNKLSNNEILKRIAKDNINVLVIQFEPFLYNINNLKILIDSVKSQGIKLIFDVHSEVNFLDKFSFILDKIIFHKNPQFLIENKKIIKIPIGVPIFNTNQSKQSLKKKYGFNDRDKILATFGFMMNWKKFPEVLELLVPFLKNNKNYKIQLLTSFHDNNPESAIVDKKIKRIIKKNNLQKQIIHLTDFLTEKEINERLYISDLGYLWADESPGSSASAKQFVSSRLPLVITNSSHFLDMDLGTVKSEININSFVKKIIETFENSKKLKNLKRQMSSLYKKFNFNKIVDEHIKMYKSFKI